MPPNHTVPSSDPLAPARCRHVPGTARAAWKAARRLMLWASASVPGSDPLVPARTRELVGTVSKLVGTVSHRFCHARSPRDIRSSAIAALTATFKLSTPAAIGIRTM